MDPGSIASNVGAVATALLGCLGLFFPAKAAAFVDVSPTSATGVSEIRATYGGLFAALGIGCLVSQSTAFFTVAGIAWVGAAAGRCWSIVIDRNFAPKNLWGIGFELTVGLLLLTSSRTGA